MSIKSFTKNLPGLGQVLFERSKKARAVNITVKPFEVIRVAVPFGMSYQQAEEIVLSKRRTLEEQVINKRQVEAEHEAKKAQQLVKPECGPQEVKALLINRLKQLADQHGFQYERVTIRSQKTKWGSCSGKANINLNCKLAELPPNMIDYVILHELVHLKHRNHSKEFWAELDQYVPNAKAVSKELKKYKLGV